MKIRILTVGKIKEKYLRDAVAEYQKRLSRYCKLEIVEVSDEKTPDGASEAEELQIKDTEADRLLRCISDTDYVIALAIDGQMPDSIGLAHKLEMLGLHGESSICFVIGGSLGLSDKIFLRANEQMSFSRLTFPHQLMRVILLEQIYRSFRINRGEPYHK
ncbi:MAG: 23S rRNA (pseudouridine(1915)-N(3))-methyltransferase RlmH [Lachnospiraceae bacterium]|nr:23S rRNA (pseudouridine(1915)-N(3))-methyltransferase RlmH [Lachnospiraceae bacterium]